MKEEKKVELIRWDDMPKEYLNPMIDRRIITSENLMLTHVYIKKGCEVPMHQHENEQFTYILEGSMKFWFNSMDSEPIIIKAGEVFTIPSNVPHGAVALEDTLDVDIFTPARLDWINKTDEYLRRG